MFVVSIYCYFIPFSVDALYYIGKLYDTKEEDENLISAYIRNVIGEADLTFKPCSSSYFMASDKNISIKYYLQAAEKVYRRKKISLILII